MSTILLLASDLGPSGAARQLQLLATELPRDRFRLEVAVIQAINASAAQVMRAAGVVVQEFPLRYPFDLRGIRKLRQYTATLNPAIIHAWGPDAVRLTSLLTHTGSEGDNTPRVVASAASILPGRIRGWLTARRLRRVDRVVASTWAEGERYRQLGVSSERLTRIGPAAQTGFEKPDAVGFRKSLGLKPSSKLIMTCGRLEPSAGLKAAIWAFDMLRYQSPELHLVIFGEGPDRAGLEQFGRALAFDDFRVVFAGNQPEFPRLLCLADVVWATHEHGGVNLALEAMAAARPVVGWKTPELSEIVEDGETGYLVPTGERPSISAKTHAILADPDLAMQLGATGQSRVAERFSVERMTEQFGRLYLELSQSMPLSPA